MDRNSKIDVEHYKEESNNQSEIIMTFYSCCVTLGKMFSVYFAAVLTYVYVYSYADQWQGCIFFFNLTRFSFIYDWFSFLHWSLKIQLVLPSLPPQF